MEVTSRSQASRSTPDVVRSVRRAFSLLGLFSPARPSLTLTQLAQQSGLALSTVSRVLQTLESLQFTRRLDNSAWGLGVRILQLCVAAQETFDVIGVSMATLKTSTALRARTRTSPFASIGTVSAMFAR